MKRWKEKTVSKVHKSSVKNHVEKTGNPLEKWMKKATAQFKEKEAETPTWRSVFIQWKQMKAIRGILFTHQFGSGNTRTGYRLQSTQPGVWTCWTNSLHHPRQVYFLKLRYVYRVCLYVLWYTCGSQRTALRSVLSFHLCVGSGNPAQIIRVPRSGACAFTLLAIFSTRDIFNLFASVSLSIQWRWKQVNTIPIPQISWGSGGG